MVILIDGPDMCLILFHNGQWRSPSPSPKFIFGGAELKCNDKITYFFLLSFSIIYKKIMINTIQNRNEVFYNIMCFTNMCQD
jgi:hypothetical protein